MFNQQDFDQIKEKGIELWKIEKQIASFREGFPFIKLIKPATINDGIISLKNEIRTKYINLFEETHNELKIVKLVPASGAASRMFKQLFEFKGINKVQKIEPQDYDCDEKSNPVYYFFSHLPEIAFYPILSAAIQNDGSSIKELISTNEYGKIIDYILNPNGLDYSNLPKALIGFHLYPDEIRTSSEEHLVEAANYAKGRGNIARIHFTILPEHRGKMDDLFAKVVRKYEKRYGVRLEITFSVQRPSTDTIAVDEFNKPCRDQNGRLLFRPGGHGALLENLNDVDADVIFIKNIDNVVPDRLKESTFVYKKLIGGYLLHVQRKIFTFLVNAENKNITPKYILEMEKFAKEMVNLSVPDAFKNYNIDSQIEFLVSNFNRPIRVCGIVKNECEPGGGPFWVSDTKHRQTLQIVESSQIDFNNDEQKNIFNASTHFNPVDLVCSIKDYKGNTFQLMRYVDENTGLISLKSSEGKTLKALELPGLWNGAMSDWITIFVEVPIITFNPVKTVNDLLRKEHLKT